MRASSNVLLDQAYQTLSVASRGKQLILEEYLLSLEKETSSLSGEPFLLEELESAVAKMDGGENWDFAPLNYYLTEKRRPAISEAYEVSIINPDGFVVASSVPGRLGRSFVGVDLFEHGRNGLYFSDHLRNESQRVKIPGQADSEKLPTWYITAPITSRKNGLLLGVLTLGIDPDILSELLTEQGATRVQNEVSQFLNEVTSTIINRDGDVIASTISSGEGRAAGPILGPLTSLALEDAGPHQASYENWQGVRVLGQVDNINMIGWRLVNEIEASVALRPVKQLGDLALGGFLFGLLTVILIAAYLTSRVIRPLYALMLANQALGAGDPDRAVIPMHKIPDDEIGMLMLSHNAMLADLQKRSGQLQIALDSGQELLTLLNRPGGGPAFLEPALRSLCDLLEAQFGMITLKNAFGQNEQQISINKAGPEKAPFIDKFPHQMLSPSDEDTMPAMMRTVDLPQEVHDYYRDHNLGKIHSFLCVPILSQDIQFGYVYLLEKEHGEYFNEEDDQRTIRFAKSLALVMENLNLIQRLQESEERYRSLYEETPVIVFQSTLEGQLLQCNPRFYKMLGYDSFEELAAINLNKLYYNPKDRMILLHELETKGSLHNYEIVLRDKFDKPRFFLNNLRISGGPAKEDQRLEGILLEITAQKNAEREKQRLQQELMQKHQSETIGTMAAGVAHEFNNLLMGIMSYAELGKMDPGASSEQQEYNSNIISQSKRGAKLVNQILAFSRQSVMNLSYTKLADLIEPTINILQGYQAGIQYERDIQKDVKQVLVDRTQLQVTITNLALNGQESMAQGGTLSFRLSNQSVGREEIPVEFDAPSGEYVCLEIGDTGTGIPEELLERIVNPFYTTKSIGEGAGLGLSQAYGVIQQHKGYLTIFSTVGKGTTVHIYLPVAPENSEVALDSEYHKPQMASYDDLSAKGECILLVEDSQVVRDAAARLLENLGYKVMLAKTGEEGIGIYEKNKNDIQLVISDITMPGASGKDVIQRIRTISPDVKLVLYSGYADAPEVAGLQEAGMIDGFIQKPFNLPEMGTLLRNLLNS